jgi:hypothetical protein
VSFERQPETAEPNKPAEAETEGKIRELGRRDSPNLRRVGGDGEVAASDLSGLLRRLSANSTREIDNLISELQTLRDRLHADSNRLEREIVEYAGLSQSVIQLTKIIADGVTHMKKVPDATGVSE